MSAIEYYPSALPQQETVAAQEQRTRLLPSFNVLRSRRVAMVCAALALGAAEGATFAPMAFGQDTAPASVVPPPDAACPAPATYIPEKTQADGTIDWKCSTDTQSTPPAAPAAPTKPKEKKPAHKEHESSSKKTENSRYSPSLGWLNMGDSSFTDDNGCFITATTSSFRVLTGNASLTPQKLYYEDKDKKDIRSQWSPGKGVERGNLFDSLPAMAAREGIHVEVAKEGPKTVTKRLRKHKDYTAMVLFNPGHFAGPSGHYLRVARVLPNGNWRLDDPNGTGKSKDSERRSGWSPKALVQQGATKFRVLSRIVSGKKH